VCIQLHTLLGNLDTPYGQLAITLDLDYYVGEQSEDKWPEPGIRREAARKSFFRTSVQHAHFYVTIILRHLRCVPGHREGIVTLSPGSTTFTRVGTLGRKGCPWPDAPTLTHIFMSALKLSESSACNSGSHEAPFCHTGRPLVVAVLPSYYYCADHGN
jgi:hypothetical protein